jgi:hypothetical protein
MSKLYQYSIKDITDIKGWLPENNFPVSSFKKIIVESVDKVQLINNFDQALIEKFILKIRFFNKDYDFHLSQNNNKTFDITILTEKELPYQKKAYEVIEKRDNIKVYCQDNNSKFTFKQYQYICEPFLSNAFEEPDTQSLPEPVAFYRIYGFE